MSLNKPFLFQVDLLMYSVVMTKKVANLRESQILHSGTIQTPAKLNGCLQQAGPE
jgi:hypothetical protein